MGEQPQVKQGAAIGGWVCFVLGILFVFFSVWSFYFYVPLFLVAFVLSIVAMSQRRIALGLTLLLATLIVPPVLVLYLSATRFSQTAEYLARQMDTEARRSIPALTGPIPAGRQMPSVENPSIVKREPAASNAPTGFADTNREATPKEGSNDPGSGERTPTDAPQPLNSNL